MSAIERLGRLTVNVSSKNPFELSVPDAKKALRLAVVEPVDFGEDTPTDSQDLVRTVMLAHLIAPHMPEIIETNFAVNSRQFLDELYNHYGYKPPIIRKSSENITHNLKNYSDKSQDQIEYASTHSGGLDSAYRLAKLMENDQSVVGVHIKNLNAKGNYSESIASEKQCLDWGIPYKQVKLLNNSANFGFDTMRTRDYFLAALTALTVHPNQAKKILVEGGMFNDPKNCHFSEYSGGWDMFNQLLKDAGLNSNVEGIDPGDIETVGEVLKLEKKLNIQIIPLIQNCFSSPYQIKNNRRKWERETPTIAQNSSDHWCGSCLKCRRMTLGRIVYNDPSLSDLTENEIEYFKKDTYHWLKKYSHNDALITESFINHLNNL